MKKPWTYERYLATVLEGDTVESLATSVAVTLAKGRTDVASLVELTLASSESEAFTRKRLPVRDTTIVWRDAGYRERAVADVLATARSLATKSGRPCGCNDCMEIIASGESDVFCHDCARAGCERIGECLALEAYACSCPVRAAAPVPPAYATAAAEILGAQDAREVTALLCAMVDPESRDDALDEIDMLAPAMGGTIEVDVLPVADGDGFVLTLGTARYRVAVTRVS